MSSALVWLTADAVVLECLGNGADGIWYVVVQNVVLVLLVLERWRKASGMPSDSAI